MSEETTPLGANEKPPDISRLMRPEEIESLCVHTMTLEQQQVLHAWGMRMYSLGQQIIEPIKAIKYDGRLIILENDSKWDIGDGDIDTSEDWNIKDKVLVMDGMMYNLEEMEKVEAQEADF